MTMPIRGLQRRQALDISNPDRIFAAGRYQIIPGTLNSALVRTGISTSGLYDSQTQDRLGLDLLIYRGLNRYLTGSLSLVDFGNSIASEWAGLPMLSGPRYNSSKYGGPNAANVDAQTVIQVLEKLKKDYELTGSVVSNSSTPTTGPQ